MTLTNAQEENLIKSLKNEAPTKYEKVWVKLHTGDPGEEGTANAATETNRKSVTLTGTNPLKNNAAAEWPAVSTSETYKFISLWSAESAGTALWSGSLEAEKAVSAGDTFIIAKEALSVELN